MGSPQKLLIGAPWRLLLAAIADWCIGALVAPILWLHYSECADAPELRVGLWLLYFLALMQEIMVLFPGKTVLSLQEHCTAALLYISLGYHSSVINIWCCQSIWKPDFPCVVEHCPLTLSRRHGWHFRPSQDRSWYDFGHHHS